MCVAIILEEWRRNEGKQDSLMVARKGCTERPVHCCCHEPSSIKKEPRQKSDKQKNGATKTGENWLVAGPSWFFSIKLNATGFSSVCVPPPPPLPWRCPPL